jgi:hypothetical protein
MLATHMNKTLIDIDQSRTRYDYITIDVEGTNNLTNSSCCSETPPWLHQARPTMVARAWPKPSPRQLEDLRRPSASSRGLLLRVGGSLMNRWMWRPMEVEAMNRWAPRAKGGVRTGPETGQANQPGLTGRGPFRPRLAIRCFLVDCWLSPLCMWALDVIFSTV